MSSIILSAATRFLMPLQLLFSIFLMLRGHNEPGGGFAGGLVVAAAWTLYALATHVDDARRLLRVEPRTLLALGLLLAVISAIVPLLRGQPFMTGQWTELHLGPLGHLHIGTPIFFDIGVYLVVIGVTLNIIFTLAEER